MINAILFDLDGTILDTLLDLHNAVNHSITKYGYKEVTINDTRGNIGNGILNLIKRSINFDESKIDLVFDEFKRYYKDNCNNYTKPYDGIYDVLDFIKSKNIKMGIITNKAKFATDILIDAHFKGYFDIVVADGMGIEKKPSPDSINYCANILNVEVSDIAYIGDSDVDIKTVINSKCQGLFLSSGFRNKEDLLKLSDKIFDNQYELLEYLKKVL